MGSQPGKAPALFFMFPFVRSCQHVRYKRTKTDFLIKNLVDKNYFSKFAFANKKNDG